MSDVLTYRLENGDIQFEMDQNRIFIVSIWVDANGHRRKGVGTRLLKEILRLADMFNLAVRLYAQASEADRDVAISQENLVAFYERFGFITTVSPEMYRKPKVS